MHWISLDPAFRDTGWLLGSIPGPGSSKIMQSPMNPLNLLLLESFTDSYNLPLPLDPARSRRIQWIYWIYHHMGMFTKFYNLLLSLDPVRFSMIQWIHWIYHILGKFHWILQTTLDSGSSRICKMFGTT